MTSLLENVTAFFSVWLQSGSFSEEHCPVSQFSGMGLQVQCIMMKQEAWNNKRKLLMLCECCSSFHFAPSLVLSCMWALAEGRDHAFPTVQPLSE